MNLPRAPRPSSAGGRRVMSGHAIAAIGFVATASYAALLAFLTTRDSYQTWGGLFIAPILVVATLPLLSRQANREDDRRVFWLLLVGLLVHLVVAAIGHHVTFNVFKGEADAFQYHENGMRLAQSFGVGDFEVNLRDGSWFGTNWPSVLNGLIYAFTLPTSLGAFFIYGWLGFFGSFLCYRAFKIAAPEGRPRSYAHLVLFVPSVAFWSSFMGKDTWVVFGLGVAVLGCAYILTGNVRRGGVWVLLGLVLVSFVRPHIAGMVGLGLLVGVLLRRPDPALRELAPVAKMLGVVVALAFSVVLLVQARQFLEDEGIDTSGNLTETLQQTSEGADYGGSVFTPVTVTDPLRLPAAAFTILFRPLPIEADSFLELVAAAEGTFLLGLTLVRWRWALTALRSVRRQPFVAFAFTYVGLFVIAFSAFANFGLLVRQRVQLMPIFFILLAIPPSTPFLRPPGHRPHDDELRRELVGEPSA